MTERYHWDKAKRRSNLEKHGFDFLHAHRVLDNPLRMDVPVDRRGERRIQAFAYVFEASAVLTVVFVERDKPRIISFRTASRKEREVYDEWLKTDLHDA